METGAPLKPQVVKRNDGYAVLNIPDVDTLTPGQKAGIGILIWEQMKVLMEANGESTKSPESVDNRIAETLKFGRKSMTTTRYAVAREGWKYLTDLIDGKVGLSQFWRKSGMKIEVKVQPPGHVKTAADGNTYYGKGDPFDDAIEPIRRYLRAWKKRNFEYRHINPGEARRRLKRVNEISSLLDEAKLDLERRSHVARLSSPSK